MPYSSISRKWRNHRTLPWAICRDKGIFLQTFCPMLSGSATRHPRLPKSWQRSSEPLPAQPPNIHAFLKAGRPTGTMGPVNEERGRRGEARHGDTPVPSGNWRSCILDSGKRAWEIRFRIKGSGGRVQQPRTQLTTQHEAGRGAVSAGMLVATEDLEMAVRSQSLPDTRNPKLEPERCKTSI